MASYLLSIQAPGQAAQTKELSLARAVIGREVGELVLADPRCSSTHAELLFDGNALRLRDLGSSNGTWVNGQRVQEHAWGVGTSVQIGSHTLVLQEIRADRPGKGRTVMGNAVVLPPVGAPAHQVVITPPAAGPANPMMPTAYGASPMNAPMHAPPQAPPPAPAHRPAPSYDPSQGGYGAPPPAAYVGMPMPHHAKKSTALWWILGGCLLLGACGVGTCGILAIGAKQASTEGSTTGAPKLAEARETTVKFVWFAGEPGPTARGGTAPARIRVGPNKSGVVSVGVFEEFAGGGGNQWRTATWLAAFNASHTVGGSLSDYEFAVHVGGHTDGPSAGMLTTATMLALLRGKKVRDDTTMTGTINPDGSAGPVGGIVQKMGGAKESGLKRFGFPIGCRNHKDMKTGEDVDLLTVGANLGLEVKEIGDLYEGYEFLTGDKLPRVEGVAEAELEPPPETTQLIKAKMGAWKSRIDREIGNLKQEVKRTGNAVQGAAGMLAEADKAYEKAQRFEKNGYFAQALDAYAQAAIAVAVSTRVTQAVYQVAKGDLNALMDGLRTAEKVKAEVDSFGAQLEIKAQATTRGGQVNTTAAFTKYVEARSAVMIGDDFNASAMALLQGLQSGKIKPTGAAVQTLMLRITTPTIYYDVAHVFVDYAKDLQDLIVDQGTAKPMDPLVVDRTVSGYASASTAVLEYFDALIVDEIAKSENVTKDEAQVYIANKESEYYFARKANMLSTYKPEGQSSPGVKLMRLAASSNAYLAGGKLVNKWYSLGGRFDKQGALVLENRRALSAQLELARKNAREAAARAKAAVGFIPTPARLEYQAGNSQREGTDEEKLEALAAYWRSTFWSELAAQR